MVRIKYFTGIFVRKFIFRVIDPILDNLKGNIFSLFTKGSKTVRDEPCCCCCCCSRVGSQSTKKAFRREEKEARKRLDRPRCCEIGMNVALSLGPLDRTHGRSSIVWAPLGIYETLATCYQKYSKLQQQQLLSSAGQPSNNSFTILVCIY